MTNKGQKVVDTYEELQSVIGDIRVVHGIMEDDILIESLQEAIGNYADAEIAMHSSNVDMDEMVLYTQPVVFKVKMP